MKLGNPLFTFTWRIENFSMRPHQVNEAIRSPTFVVDSLEKTEWKLYLIFKTFDPNFVNVYLRRLHGNEYLQDITIFWSLDIFSKHNSKDIQYATLQRKLSPGGFSKRLLIFENMRDVLPNDVLTLRCQLSRCIQKEETNHSVPHELNTDCWNSSPPFQKYEFSARTRIKVSSTSFVWPIKRIGEIACGVKLKTLVCFAINRQRSLDLSLALEEDSEKSIRIAICKKKQDGEGIFVRCHIRTVGAPKTVQYQGMDKHYFPAWMQNKVWIFPTFLKLKYLTERYFHYTDGCLYLRFDLWRSKQYSELDIEYTDERLPLDIFKEREIPGASTSNFAELYRSGELVDTTLRVRDREYHVHKFILCAGSDVFRRMFLSGMKEQQSGVVDIFYDPDIMERLIKYMYTYELGELNPEDA